ncbi:MAG: hypothetical protein R3305_06345 [Gammaproteobacteria bacterium]|nr:hypothetical protein [Gammaproteobacteria bacterium]
MKADHVMSRVAQLRGGRINDPRFGSRLKGEGQFGELFAKRFALACRKHGLNRERIELETGRFKPPRVGPQIELF